MFNDSIRVIFKPLLRIIFRLSLLQQQMYYLLSLLKALLNTHRTYSQFVALDILMKHERDLILSIELSVAAVKRGNTYKFVVDR